MGLISADDVALRTSLLKRRLKPKNEATNEREGKRVRERRDELWTKKRLRGKGEGPSSQEKQRVF